MKPVQLLRSARARILLAVIALLVASTVIATLLTRQILLSRVGDRVDAQLAQEVEEFRALARDGRDPRTGRPFGDDLRAVFDVYLLRNVPNAGEAWHTFVEDRPYRSTTGDAAIIRRLTALQPVKRVVRERVESTSGPLQLLGVPVTAGRRSGTFAVTADLASEQAEVTDSLRTATGVSLLVLLAVSLIAFLIAGRVLAPLRDLTETARTITDTDLTRRIDVDGQDEIAELGHTFNEMLGRLEQAFSSQRAFVSDAGHELRTPITIIRGHLELISDDPAERAETLALVSDELDRMARLVEDLLTLARSEQLDFLRLEDLDLDLLTEELAGKARLLADREWVLVAVGAGRLRADRQRLTQAAMNLASNAAQHTEPGDRIELGSALVDSEARLWVADAGPGVHPAERDRIFERFARAARGRRRSEGAGLGLAIIRAIADAHGGRIELESPNDKGGATFTVIVPADPPPEMEESR